MKTIPQMVNWSHAMGEDTGEGGLAVYLLIPKDDRRTACTLYAAADWSYGGDPSYGDQPDEGPMDATLLIGSTRHSFYDEETGMFHATYDDLTDSGRRLYDALEQIYGEKPAIVTLLDT